MKAGRRSPSSAARRSTSPSRWCSPTCCLEECSSRRPASAVERRWDAHLTDGGGAHNREQGSRARAIQRLIPAKLESPPADAEGERQPPVEDEEGAAGD